jgi:flagellar biosynthesis protein FliR
MDWLIPQLATSFMLTFARIGTMVMLMPGIGERVVSARARMAFALLLTLVMFPTTRPLLLGQGAPQATIMLMFSEILIGLTLGLAVRVIVSALQTAGNIVAQQLGLSFAMTVDPTLGNQQASIANLLTLLGTTLVFVMDLHHLAIGAMRESYTLLPPMGIPDVGDAASLAVKAMSRSFALAVQMSAPFIVFGILFNLGLGLLSRLMPQLQIFFLAMPATILMGSVILMAVLSVMMGLFIEQLGGFMNELGGR